MKKLFLIPLLVFLINAQIDVRGGFVRSELYAGADYRLKSIPVVLQADLIFASDIIIELGAMYRYAIKSERGLYVLASGLFATGSGVSDFTLYPGVGYEISRKVSLEAGYGLTGIKEFRAAVIFRL